MVYKGFYTNELSLMFVSINDNITLYVDFTNSKIWQFVVSRNRSKDDIKECMFYYL